jgi:diaminohydroxyphosphoribosylaminopyrimidine deaminase/5-amino-6-(5-phosphoribosylamino)uracil reductase
MHLVRGEYDAVMVGINTVLRDDPRLTVRHRQWPRKTLIRIVLDSALRFPLRARMLSTRASGRIHIFTSSSAASPKKDALRKMGVEIVEVPGSSGMINLKDVLSRLGEQGIASVLVEGGSRLLTSLLEKKLADKLFLTVSPRLIGGKTAPSFLEGRGADLIRRSWRLRKVTAFNLGEDILLEGYF